MQVKCQAPCTREVGKKRGLDICDGEGNGDGIVEHRGNEGMEVSSEVLSSEVSGEFSVDATLALREPTPGRFKAKPNFARAPDLADEDIVLSKPRA